MLQLLVCSDVHTFTDNIRLAIEKTGQVDAVLIAGDLESEKERLLESVGSLPCYAVCGNNDYYLDTTYPYELLIDISDAGPGSSLHSGSQEQAIHPAISTVREPDYETHPKMSSEILRGPAIAGIRELSYDTLPEKLSSLPPLIKSIAPPSILARLGSDKRPDHSSHRILLTHGNIYKVPDTEGLLQRAILWDADIVIYGHTHKFADFTTDNKKIRFLNPGCLLGDPDSSIRQYAGYEICSFAVLQIGSSGEILFRQLHL